jgi:glycosyltransferase involved in cell wall biosynthesis
VVPSGSLGELISPDMAVIATASQTAVNVSVLPHGRRYYFVRGWETWEGTDEGETVKSFWLPVRIIVTSKWLHDLVKLLSNAHVSRVPNPIDLGHFTPRIPPQDRDPRSILFYYNDLSRKDWPTARKVLQTVVTRFPVKATVYGTKPPPDTLPNGVELVVRPSRSFLPELYSRHALFVHTSFMEGWGLPPMEALACGCACVMTDSLGVRDYLDETHLSRLRAPGDSAGLSEQLVEWMEDPKARVAAALAGMASVARFTWERSLSTMEQVLSE